MKNKFKFDCWNQKNVFRFPKEKAKFIAAQIPLLSVEVIIPLLRLKVIIPPLSLKTIIL